MCCKFHSGQGSGRHFLAEPWIFRLFIMPCMISRLSFFFLPLWAFTLPNAALAEPSEVFTRTLDNGLKVLVQPDTRAPVAVQQLWYGVGAAHEPPGQTGISHVLEHMMFRGTERFPGESFSHTIDYPNTCLLYTSPSPRDS